MFVTFTNSALANSPHRAGSPAPHHPSRPVQKRPRTGTAFGHALVTVARGIAFFVATYSLLSLFAYALGNRYNQNVWWIDLGFMPGILGLFFQVCLIISLYAFVVRIPRRFLTRALGAIPSTLFAAFAIQNMIGVYAADIFGQIELGFPLPFSFFILIVFVLLAFAILFGAPLLPAARSTSRAATVITMILTVCVIGVLFPLGQLLCFGTTEYKGKADVTVVFGAQVYPDGTPSPVLQDRLDKAIELYGEGRAGHLLMSGGIDVDGTSEAAAMRNYARAKGVPAADLLIDEQGMTTEDSAANTVQMIRQEGFEQVSAVSNFYHLARIKMDYLAKGLDVKTIPAGESKGGPPAPLTFLREIPGWWVYWFTNLAPAF